VKKFLLIQAASSKFLSIAIYKNLATLYFRTDGTGPETSRILSFHAPVRQSVDREEKEMSKV
jgi:hypothetical protein